MARTMKFGLRCGENSVRTLDDLCDNFVIEDILAHYHSGQLQRWLKVWGYTKEFQQVESIKAEDDEGILRELIRIFDIEQDEQEIKAILEDLTHKSMQQQVKHTQQLVIESQKSNSDALCEYYEIVNTILDNPFDMPKIRNAIYEIDINYREIYDRDYKNLFYRLLRGAPLAFCVMLTRKNMRIPLGANSTKDKEETKQMCEAFLTRFYTGYDAPFTAYFHTEILFEDSYNLVKLIERTKGYRYSHLELPKAGQKILQKNGIWCANLQVPDVGYNKHIYDSKIHVLEPKGKKFMILDARSCDVHTKLRDAHTHTVIKSDLEREDFDNMLFFPIVNGIEFTYKSGTSNMDMYIFYMEV